jgi:broad specificity phosphatase PhoE
VRLGGVAANLARIESASANEAHCELVRNMIQDSEFLIEWTAPDAEISTASELVEMQIQLAIWQLKWQTIWSDMERRKQVAAQAGQWSERVLELSGLLDEN